VNFKRGLAKPLNLPFIVLVLLLILLPPIQPLIQLLALKPNYELSQFCLEFWRIITGHLIHASWTHLGANLINVVLVRIVFREWLQPKQFIFFIFFSAVFISVGLWNMSSLKSYVGFSGIFHGLLLYLLLTHWKRAPILFSIAIALVVGKIIHEQIYGASPALVDFIGVGVAIDSHLLGILSGLCFWILDIYLLRPRQIKKS
jgi:rhomboid family GlyGly-CTERM serine protease